MAFAVDTGLRQDNPTLGIKRPKLRGEGFKTWSEADIAQFENRHPVGSRARLALALLLYTGQRRGDVIRMGPQHVNNGGIELRQSAAARNAVSLMRSLASGFTLEKLRACLNWIARIASVTAKRANLAEARLPVGLDLIRPLVEEAFELLS
jgi:integrase